MQCPIWSFQDPYDSECDLSADLDSGGDADQHDDAQLDANDDPDTNQHTRADRNGDLGDGDQEGVDADAIAGESLAGLQGRRGG